MNDPIERLVRSWSDYELSKVNSQIIHLEKRLFKTYEPERTHAGKFWSRLAAWLDGVSSDQQKRDLFSLVPYLVYLGPDEFEELYRAAYEGPIARWTIDRSGIDVFSAIAGDTLRSEIKQTWFCPISDSMRVNAFSHINMLAAGADYRPDWRSLSCFGDPEKISGFCKAKGIKRLVLLEDFVGGGSQAEEAIRFALRDEFDFDVLFVPLVVCPDGAINARTLAEAERARLAKRNRDFSFAPILELPVDAFFKRDCHSPDFSADYSARLVQLLEDTYSMVSGGVVGGKKPYDPFGYPADKPTGGLVVMYSNTPDNTLPIVHWRPHSGSWSPLFPRHSRV
jgi:hypothetical protein